MDIQKELNDTNFFDIENQKFLVFRDVVFHENIFPFHKVTTLDQQSLFISNVVLPQAFNIELPFVTNINSIRIPQELIIVQPFILLTLLLTHS